MAAHDFLGKTEGVFLALIFRFPSTWLALVRALQVTIAKECLGGREGWIIGRPPNYVLYGQPVDTALPPELHWALMNGGAGQDPPPTLMMHSQRREVRLYVVGGCGTRARHRVTTSKSIEFCTRGATGFLTRSSSSATATRVLQYSRALLFLGWLSVDHIFLETPWLLFGVGDLPVLEEENMSVDGLEFGRQWLFGRYYA